MLDRKGPLSDHQSASKIKSISANSPMRPDISCSIIPSKLDRQNHLFGNRQSIKGFRVWYQKDAQLTRFIQPLKLGRVFVKSQISSADRYRLAFNLSGSDNSCEGRAIVREAYMSFRTTATQDIRLRSYLPRYLGRKNTSPKSLKHLMAVGTIIFLDSGVKEEKQCIGDRWHRPTNTPCSIPGHSMDGVGKQAIFISQRRDGIR